MKLENILLVDDNPDNLMLLELLLVGENLAVQTATSGPEALQLLESSLPDLVLTDIQMPGMDGLELIRRIRRDPRTGQIHILAVSANAMKENIDEAHAAGCDGYITKPVDTRTFATSLREHFDLGRNRAALSAQPMWVVEESDGGTPQCIDSGRRHFGL